MTDDMKPSRPYRKAERKPWLSWLAVVVVSAGVSALGTATIMWAKLDSAAVRLEKSDHAVKDLFFEFCIKRANKYPTNDADAKKACDAIWQGTLAANRDAGTNISPFKMAAIVEVESMYNQRAVSPAMAIGLTQIHLPAHGRAPFGCDILEQVCNVYTGTRIFGQALAAFGGDERLALLAYNRGVAAVRASLRNGDPSGGANGYAKKVRRVTA